MIRKVEPRQREVLDMPSDYASDQKTLLDAFFHEQDQKLLSEFRQKMEKMNRREQLARVSGIKDEAALDRLVELDIGPETLAVMTVVPLVCVAWADRMLHAKEREAIIAAAEAAGVKPQEGRYPILELWLAKRPGRDLLEAWKHYIKDVCERLAPEEKERLKHDLLDRARDVAAAAGGVLGLGSRISAAEQAVLDDLEKAFG